MKVFQSHNMRECNRWNRSTISQIRAMVLDDDVDPMEYPESDYLEPNQNLILNTQLKIVDHHKSLMIL